VCLLVRYILDVMLGIIFPFSNHIYLWTYLFMYCVGYWYIHAYVWTLFSNISFFLFRGIIQFINFSYVRTNYQLLYTNSAFVIWTTYIAYIGFQKLDKTCFEKYSWLLNRCPIFVKYIDSTFHSFTYYPKLSQLNLYYLYIKIRIYN
jgi:hypothetical protein